MEEAEAVRELEDVAAVQDDSLGSMGTVCAAPPMPSMVSASRPSRHCSISVRDALPFLCQCSSCLS